MYRSRSKKKRDVKTPKKTVPHYKRKPKGKHRCAECGAVLHGMSEKKRPSRKYGGYLCHQCVTKKMVESVRS